MSLQAGRLTFSAAIQSILRYKQVHVGLRLEIHPSREED